MRVDHALVCRVEASAAAQTTLLAATMAARSPSSGARAEPLDGGVLVALGPGRYVNRAMGVGLGGLAAGELLDAVEEFYGRRQMPAMLEVSPWVPAATVAELGRRGYRVQWFRNVLVRELTDLPPSRETVTSGTIAFRTVDSASLTAWTAILGELTSPGSTAREINDEFCEASHHSPGEEDLLAVVADVPVACGSWYVVDRIGWIGAAATLTSARGRGAQHALVVERLRRIAAAGADIAAATALPDGQSARNMIGLGFSVLYTQAVMTRDLDP